MESHGKQEQSKITSSEGEVKLLKEQIRRLEEDLGMHKMHIEYLEQQHGIDHLTGVSTRKVFENELKLSLQFVRGEIREHRKGGDGSREIALVFVDLDHFKQINDTYGHPVGDEVLKRVATLLSNSVREADIVARVGGEEFVVLLRGADQVFAAFAAEKFRAEIEKLEFDDIGVPGLKVTGSFGVSSSNSSTDATVLYDHADKAAYKAKGRGRNTVVVHGNGKNGANHNT